MEIKSEAYKYYLRYEVGKIPDQELNEVIKEFSSNAIFMMGSEHKPDDLRKTHQSVLYLIRSAYSFLPLHLIAEAFSKGSVGDLGGTTKFSARNVNIWLREIKDKHYNLIAEEKSREDNQRRSEVEKIFKSNQANNVIYGTALFLKLSWAYEGRIDPENWEKYSLDAIVNELRNGYTVKTLRASDIYYEKPL